MVLTVERKIDAVQFVDRAHWRRWLVANHASEMEVWLILPKKAAGGASCRVYYGQALEEAICFGWIDSRIKPLDATRSLVRFTPRRSKNWSARNLETALKLLKEGRMTPSGLQTLPSGILKPEQALPHRRRRRSSLRGNAAEQPDAADGVR
jgi:uncharacterized protein YdeI (YjbR/CyaY-like superfamily)